MCRNGIRKMHERCSQQEIQTTMQLWRQHKDAVVEGCIFARPQKRMARQPSLNRE